MDIRKLDKETLETLLQEFDKDLRLADFDIVSRADCGDGVASTADRINLELYYANNPRGIPDKLVLKTLLLHPVLRLGLPAIMLLSRVVGVLESLPLLGSAMSGWVFKVVGVFQQYFPQAPDAMYEIESRFYRELRPRLGIRAPQIYGARYDRNTRQFAVLMEDLAVADCHFPSALESLELDTVKSTLTELARLHAAFWQSDELEQGLAWVPTRISGGMYPVFKAIGFDLIRYHVQQSEFKKQLLRPVGKSLKELWEATWESQKVLMQGPQTLLHGDAHVGNTYIMRDGQGGLIDFQLLVRGHPVIDVCYYITTALDIDSRRKFEKQLLEHYLQQIGESGVVDVPDLDEFRSQYRIASIWGLVIGWLITPTVNYGEAITKANVERLSQAVLDLQAFDALEESISRRENSQG